MLLKHMPQTEKLTITIFGGGEMGSCLSRLLLGKGEVLVWDKLPEKRNTQESLEQILKRTALLFLAVPSAYLEQALGEIKQFLPKSALVICLSKGLLPGKTTEQALRENLANPFALLAGPMLAEELNAGLPGFGVVASEKSACETLQKLFASTNVYLEQSQDLRSVAYASALKNIYAVLMGIAESFSFGQNWRGFLTAKVFAEWELLAQALQLDITVLRGRAGAADFIATAFSPYSRNRETGEVIVKNKVIPAVEGTNSLKNLLVLLEQQGTALPPLLNLLGQIVLEQADARTLLESYLNSLKQ